MKNKPEKERTAIVEFLAAWNLSSSLCFFALLFLFFCMSIGFAAAAAVTSKCLSSFILFLCSLWFRFIHKAKYVWVCKVSVWASKTLHCKANSSLIVFFIFYFFTSYSFSTFLLSLSALNRNKCYSIFFYFFIFPNRTILSNWTISRLLNVNRDGRISLERKKKIIFCASRVDHFFVCFFFQFLRPNKIDGFTKRKYCFS